MTEYADIAQINALQAEQANIDWALTLLDEHDGTVSGCSIVATDAPLGQSPPGATVAMIDAPQAMISGVRAGLIQRFNEINRELADLGVSGTPPDHSPGGPPVVEVVPA